MTSFLDRTVVAVFVVWFLISALRQLAALRPLGFWRSWFLRHDPLGLIPVWTFFAPRPAWSDYHLLRRHLLPDQSFTAWSEVSIIVPRRWWHALFNPAKRSRKAIVDAIRMLARAFASAGSAPNNMETKAPSPLHPIGGTACRSIPYLVLLHYVVQTDHVESPSGTQFMIVRCDAGDPHRAGLVLLSPVHAF